MHAGDARLRVEPMRFKVVDLGFGERGLKFSADGQWCLGMCRSAAIQEGSLVENHVGPRTGVGSLIPSLCLLAYTTQSRNMTDNVEPAPQDGAKTGYASRSRSGCSKVAMF